MHELLHRHFNFFPLYKWNFCCVSTATQYAASVHYIIIAAFVYLFHVFFFRQGFPTELDLKNWLNRIDCKQKQKTTKRFIIMCGKMIFGTGTQRKKSTNWQNDLSHQRLEVWVLTEKSKPAFESYINTRETVQKVNSFCFVIPEGRFKNEVLFVSHCGSILVCSGKYTLSWSTIFDCVFHVFFVSLVFLSDKAYVKHRI